MSREIQHSGNNLDGESTVLAGRLPEREPSLSPGLGQNEYTCNFGFVQPVSDSSVLPSNDDVFNLGGGLIDRGSSIECTDPALNLPQCFVVAGSNDNRPIFVDTQEVTPEEMDQRHPDLLFDGGVALTPFADNTQNPQYNQDNTETPFQNFPVEAPGSDVDTTRNPFYVWEDNQLG